MTKIQAFGAKDVPIKNADKIPVFAKMPMIDAKAQERTKNNRLEAVNKMVETVAGLAPVLGDLYKPDVIRRRLMVCADCTTLRQDGCGSCPTCKSRWTAWRDIVVFGHCENFGEDAVTPPEKKSTIEGKPKMIPEKQEDFSARAHIPKPEKPTVFASANSIKTDVALDANGNEATYYYYNCIYIRKGERVKEYFRIVAKDVGEVISLASELLDDGTINSVALGFALGAIQSNLSAGDELKYYAEALYMDAGSTEKKGLALVAKNIQDAIVVINSVSPGCKIMSIPNPLPVDAYSNDLVGK